jgi:hypothetical protein
MIDLLFTIYKPIVWNNQKTVTILIASSQLAKILMKILKTKSLKHPSCS